MSQTSINGETVIFSELNFKGNPQKFIAMTMVNFLSLHNPLKYQENCALRYNGLLVTSFAHPVELD